MCALNETAWNNSIRTLVAKEVERQLDARPVDGTSAVGVLAGVLACMAVCVQGMFLMTHSQLVQSARVKHLFGVGTAATAKTKAVKSKAKVHRSEEADADGHVPLGAVRDEMED